MLLVCVALRSYLSMLRLLWVLRYVFTKLLGRDWCWLEAVRTKVIVSCL